jgi:hypothetical protein
VAKAALRRDLGPVEDAGLRVALDLVNEEASGGDPTLPMVVDALLHPRAQRLCEGDLRGMFDGKTSEGIDLEAGH